MKKILIIEDNPISREVLKNSLEGEHYIVIEAVDGSSALYEAAKQKFDLIIQDLFLPGTDGFSLNQELRKLPYVDKTPIFALSGFLNPLDQQVNLSGFATLLFKPIDPSYLLDVVKTHLHILMPLKLNNTIGYNANLAQRCSMLSLQLSLIGGISHALTISNKGIYETLKDFLYFFLDATGISKGALYLKKSNLGMELIQQVGCSENQNSNGSIFRVIEKLIPAIIAKNEPYVIPCEFLYEANVKYAVIVPISSGTECWGLLFLGSDIIHLSGENIIEFVRTLTAQLGESIARVSILDKLIFSEKKYKQLIEISPDAIFIRQDGKFVYANNAALTLLGANNLDDLSVYADHKNLLAEDKIKTLNGNIIDVEIVTSQFIYQGNPVVYVIMRDITERKRSELHLEIQYAIAWMLAESSTLFGATAKMLRIICERLQWDCGTIWAIDKAANVMRCTRVWQMPQIQNNVFRNASKNLVIKPGVGVPGRVWEERKAIWISNISNDASFLRQAPAAELGFNTAVAFPILYENEILGIIEFFSKNILYSDNKLLLWFESIGNQFGVFLMRKHMEKQMLYLSEHDALTGLSNRSLLEQYLNSAITIAKENNQKLAVLFLDLDNFKYINDSMGHQAGDILLKEVSARFKQCLRPQDTISRLGGDEFIIILPDIHNKNEIIDIIIRLQNKLSSEIALKEKEFIISSSIGISLYPNDGHTVQTLIKSADIAMYAAKSEGKNNFKFCTREMTTSAKKRGILQNDLRQAFEKDELILYYQPKIDIVSQKVTGVEGLIRWQKLDAIISPNNFISAAEGSDIIVLIGEWVLQEACLQNKIWQAARMPPLTISVNLSIRNLNNKLLHVVEKILSETEVNPESIEIELTESILMENANSNVQILRSLKEMGLKISIDDFGTGYSSLSYLKRFPIDTLKIDQSFVRDIATDADDAAIVIAIIAMAHSLGFKVIAEGVETKEQLRFLCDHDCDEIQGYYFSRPLPVAEATKFIQNANIIELINSSRIAPGSV